MGGPGWAAPGMQTTLPRAAAARPHLQQQHSGGAGAQCGLQQARELRVAEGHVWPASPQRSHHSSQRQQRAVDGPSLPQTLSAVPVFMRRAGRPCLPGALGPCQVH